MGRERKNASGFRVPVHLIAFEKYSVGTTSKQYFLCVQTWCTPMTMLPMEQNVETMLQMTAGQVTLPRARKAMFADNTTVAKRFESAHSTNNEPTNDCQLLDEMLGVVRHSRRCRNVKCTRSVGTPNIKSTLLRGECRMFFERSIHASNKPCRCNERLSRISCTRRATNHVL